MPFVRVLPKSNTARAASGFFNVVSGVMTETAESTGKVFEASSGAFSRGQVKGRHEVNLHDKRLADELHSQCLAEGMTDEQASEYINSLFDRYGVQS